MNMVSDTLANGVVVRLQGRLDSATSAEAEKSLLALIDGGATKVVLDLSQLDMVTSAGLRVLLVVARRLKRADGKLALFALQPLVREIFETSGFTNVLSVVDAEAEALASVQK